MNFEEAHRAIKRGDLVRLRAELEGGLSPNFGNRLGARILILAAIHGDTQIGRLLIEKGADTDHRSSLGWTALSCAVMAGKTSFVSFLLTSGASLDCDSGGTLDSFVNWVERYCAVSKQQADNIRALIDAEREVRGTLSI